MNQPIRLSPEELLAAVRIHGDTIYYADETTNLDDVLAAAERVVELLKPTPPSVTINVENVTYNTDPESEEFSPPGSEEGGGQR